MNTTIDTPAGPVSIAWDTPKAPVAVFALAHGAGGSIRSPGVRDIANALAQRGIVVMRFNFAYTERQARMPDRMPTLLEVWQAAADEAHRAYPRLPLLIGGRSMGGRAASHLAAEGYACDGVIFLAYPLHPPGRTDRIRDEHLRSITPPILWIQGTRDPLAEPDLLHAAVAALPRVTLVEIDGGDHSFNVPGRPAAGVTAQIADVIASWVADLVRT